MWKSPADGNVVTVKGPKGTLTQNLHPEMIIEQEGNTIHVKRPPTTSCTALCTA